VKTFFWEHSITFEIICFEHLGKFLPLLYRYDIDELKLRDLTKLWIFKVIMMKSNFKKARMSSF